VLIAKYEVRLIGDAMYFVDMDGNTVNALDVWELIAVADCAVSIKKNVNEFDPVTYKNVRRDKRYVKETIHIMVGLEVE
jgi:hypothetical protein